MAPVDEAVALVDIGLGPVGEVTAFAADVAAAAVRVV